jgi:hypothetical protein
MVKICIAVPFGTVVDVEGERAGAAVALDLAAPEIGGRGSVRSIHCIINIYT